MGISWWGTRNSQSSDMGTLQKALNKSKQTEPSFKEKVAAAIFGVSFLIALIVLAIFFPEPKPFQYLIFRLILALAAAGAGALIPGFLHVEIKPAARVAMRAGGAIGILLIVYFTNPASLVSKVSQRESPESSSVDKPRMKMSVGGIVVDESRQQVIGQATITLVGRSETDTSDDSGNFRIDLTGDIPNRVRLHVSKAGFQAKDLTIEPPVENLVIQMHKQ